MNKKGDLASILVITAVLFALAIVSLIISDPLIRIMDEFKNNSKTDAETDAIITTVQDDTIGYLDYLFLFSFFAMLIGTIISAVYMKMHPAFMVVFLIMLLIAVTLAGMLANIYLEQSNSTQFANEYEEFVFTSNLMEVFPTLILIVGAIIIIVIYGKSKMDRGSPGEIYG